MYDYQARADHKLERTPTNFRLPIGMRRELARVPNKSEFVRQAIADALETRASNTDSETR